MNIQPLTLTGQTIRLEPLALAHVPALAVAGRDESLWRFMPYGSSKAEGFIQAWVSQMLLQFVNYLQRSLSVLLFGERMQTREARDACHLFIQA